MYILEYVHVYGLEYVHVYDTYSPSQEDAPAVKACPGDDHAPIRFASHTCHGAVSHGLESEYILYIHTYIPCRAPPWLCCVRFAPNFNFFVWFVVGAWVPCRDFAVGRLTGRT